MQVSIRAMKIPGVFAIVMLAGATAASAGPARDKDNARISYKDEAAKKAPDDAPRDGEWVQLASPTPASHGTEFVVVGKEQGEFAQLRIDPSAGRVVVRRVKIYFDDGKQKIVDVDKVIDASRKNSATIALDSPRAIDRIVVSTETGTKGSYAIVGQAGASSTAVSRR